MTGEGAPAGTLITTDPPVTPTEATPAPPKLNAEWFAVPEVLCVVFDTAKRDRFKLAKATEPLELVKLNPRWSEKPRVWKALDPPAALNAWLL